MLRGKRTGEGGVFLALGNFLTTRTGKELKFKNSRFDPRLVLDMPDGSV